MQAVRQRVVDRVEVRVGDQRVVALVHAGDAVFGGKGPARDPSRAAPAATTTSALSLAGLMSDKGAIRAAPRMPIRSGAPCPDTDPTLALGHECAASAAATSERRRVFGPDPNANEIGGQHGQPRQALDHAQQRSRWCGVRAAKQRAEQRLL